MVQNRDNIKLEIIQLLIKENSHVRDIAKKLNESHSTISRRLSELVKDNILDYKKQGKNKVFFLKDNITTKSHIIKAELHKKIKLLKKYPELSIIFQEILNKTDKKLIILFGSYAKFKAKKDSDVDIYIETKNRNIKKLVQSINSKISVKIGSFDKKSPLIREIIKDHVIIRGLESFYEKT